MSELAIGTGQSFAVLANAVSDAVHAALKRGMETDEAVCCAAAVLADYAMAAYGPGYLPALASIIATHAQAGRTTLSLLNGSKSKENTNGQ